jgi:hypothetical protein
MPDSDSFVTAMSASGRQRCQAAEVTAMGHDTKVYELLAKAIPARRGQEGFARCGI